MPTHAPVVRRDAADVTATDAPDILAPAVAATPARVAELDHLGDEIATLSAHLDAATARLLDLIRDFDARGGWNTGSAPAPSGSAGASASSPAPPASASAWRAPWECCRAWPRPSPAASCPTPKCGL